MGVLPSSGQQRCKKHTAQKFKADLITLVLLFTEQSVEKISGWAEVGDDTGIVKEGWSSREEFKEDKNPVWGVAVKISLWT